jgi:hypothetical protein
LNSFLPDDVTFVLKTFQDFEVQALLMGGQACVLYGGSEFSRDVDFAIHADETNLETVEAAMTALQAEIVAVPNFSGAFLEQGLAVHFRCGVKPAAGLRVDVMTRMRGVDPFPRLWERRTVFTLPESLEIAVLGIRDLVLAKKTQRDKDWPMITRLVEAHFFSNQDDITTPKVEFWLEELRTPELILEVVDTYPELAAEVANRRPLLLLQAAGELGDALEVEEKNERARDREYWKPLRKRLEELRENRRSK